MTQLRKSNPVCMEEGSETLPVTEKTYLCKELYIETRIRNPKMVGLFGYR